MPQGYERSRRPRIVLCLAPLFRRSTNETASSVGSWRVNGVLKRASLPRPRPRSGYQNAADWRRRRRRSQERLGQGLHCRPPPLSMVRRRGDGRGVTYRSADRPTSSVLLLSFVLHALRRHRKFKDLFLPSGVENMQMRRPRPPRLPSTPSSSSSSSV